MPLGMGLMPPQFSTENRPMGSPAAAPPSNVYAGGAGAAYNPTTSSATIPYSTAGLQMQGGQPLAQPPSAQPAAQGGAPGGNVIGGALPWGAGAGNMFQGLGGDPATTLANLGSNYANAYNSSLQQNQANYNNILAGYQQTAGNQAAGQAATQAGYGQLSNDVMGGIAGIGSDQQALLGRLYTQQRGNAMQGLINSGLGNSTVTSSVNRGIGLDESLARNNLANSIAQTKAGFQSNLGLAGLGYAGQSVRDNSALAQNQLGWMNSVNAGYPDAGMYGQLAMQAGAAQQSALNRQQLDRLNGQNSDLGAQIRQAAVLGGSGGMAPGTGGRLPPSMLGGLSSSSPGIGTGGTPGGDAFFQYGPGGGPGVGQGGGGSMQVARGGGSRGGGGGFGGGPVSADALALGGNMFDQANWSIPSYAGNSYPGIDKPSTDPIFGFDLSGGGADYYGGMDQPGAADVAYGFGSGGFGGVNDAMASDAGSYGSTIPNYDYYGAAAGLGAGAFGGAYGDYYDEGY